MPTAITKKRPSEVFKYDATEELDKAIDSHIENDSTENALNELAPLPELNKSNPVAPKTPEEIDLEFDNEYNLLCQKYLRRHVGTFPRFEAHQIVKSAIDSPPSVVDLNFPDLKVQRLN